MLRTLLAMLLLLPFSGFAQNFVAGKDYELITDKPVIVNNQSITVKEFFSYGCPWCYRIEPSLQKWVRQQGNKINFTKVPVIFNKDWAFYAKAFYTADVLGYGEKFNTLLFKAVQVDKTPLNNEQAMIDFFIAHGINKDITESAFNHSTTIDMKINEANLLMAHYHITGVPAFVIGNKFKTDLQMAQNEERLFKLLNYLISQVKVS